MNTGGMKMTEKILDIGVVGMAVMGRSLALNMADHGFEVGGYNRSYALTAEVLQQHPHPKMHGYEKLEDMIAAMKLPRRVFLMIQAGRPVDMVIDQLIPMLEPGDIIMDGGNSFYEDTNRREAKLKEKGILYFGVGVSGGEEGARRGPSIMPGGDANAYKAVQPILEAISAKAEGEPCCTYIGPQGAGHYVKMVHNGIEYADMELIAEAYILLKEVGGYTNQELADLFAAWNEGELRSYLIGITAEIFKEKDDLSEGELIDRILDSASQKGTGRWAAIESLKQGVDISMITAAGNARVMSNDLARRKKAASLINKITVTKAADKKAFAETIRRALYMGKIIAYAQGFSLLQNASDTLQWKLDLAEIASIWRAGCIIQAEFLNDITAAYTRDPGLSNLIFDSFFLERVNLYQQDLRTSAAQGITNGIAVPAMVNAAAYLDEFRAETNGANLIQAQRDYFGAHTYQRNDREGTYHHQWKESV